MAIKKGLGKGLDALLGDYQQPTEESVKEIDVNLIDTNSSQPRKSFDKEKLDELANSIKNHGIVQPIVVRRTGERYTIVAGERRYRAARIAGLNKVPVVVKDMDDYQVMEVAIIDDGASVSYAIVGENCRIGRRAAVGAPPETARQPAQWGIAVLGPRTCVADGETVPPKTMLDKTHGKEAAQ